MAEFDFEDCRTRMRQATQIVLDKEKDCELAVESAADAEAVYRNAVAKKFEDYRQLGKAVEESTTLARRDVALLARERDYRKGLEKLAFDRLENARDSRRSVWRLVEWARERDLIAARAQVNHQMELDARMGVGAVT